jgi:hypothetical protein
MKAIAEELRAFETGALDPAQFPHSEHVRLAYEMLARYPFGEAVTRFSRGLKLLAAKAGRPEVYHETITIAFLALVGERRAAGRNAGWREFRADNADLLDKRCLEKWYGKEQLSSDLARRTFCLPQGAAVYTPPTPAWRDGRGPVPNC